MCVCIQIIRALFRQWEIKLNEHELHFFVFVFLLIFNYRIWFANCVLVSLSLILSLLIDCVCFAIIIIIVFKKPEWLHLKQSLNQYFSVTLTKNNSFVNDVYVVFTRTNKCIRAEKTRLLSDFLLLSGQPFYFFQFTPLSLSH